MKKYVSPTLDCVELRVEERLASRCTGSCTGTPGDIVRVTYGNTTLEFVVATYSGA